MLEAGIFKAVEFQYRLCVAGYNERIKLATCGKFQDTTYILKSLGIVLRLYSS